MFHKLDPNSHCLYTQGPWYMYNVPAPTILKATNFGALIYAENCTSDVMHCLY